MENKIHLEDLPNIVSEINQKIDNLTEIIRGLIDTKKTNERPMDLNEVAKYLNLCKATIYTKVSHGKIPYHKPGKHLIFFRSEIDSYIKDNRLKKAEKNVWNNLGNK